MVQKHVRSQTRDSRKDAEEALLQDNLAQEAFDQLTQKWGVDGKKLMELLVAIPHCSDKVLPIVHGMGDITVRKLPDRIRGWAESIEKINASPWLTPGSLPRYASIIRNPGLFPKPLDVILTPDWAGPTANLFNGLPGRLRFYADHLEARLKIFHPIGQERRELGYKQVRLRTWLTLELLRLVREAGHGPRYKQVATLLNRAYLVAGKARTIGEDNLSKLETNNSWFTFLIQEDKLRQKSRQAQGPPS
jgi:hypothetical protein